MPIEAGLTRFATETRVRATDPEARARFRRYWRWAGWGIVAIRWLLLPAIRREAERRWRAIGRRDARRREGGPVVTAFGRSVRADRVERAALLPGDDLLPGAIASMTHAVSIERPRREVWPWLAQMGTGRAGWYSYDRIDNGGRASADRLLSEYQGVTTGTLFPAGPRRTDGFVALRLAPARSSACRSRGRCTTSCSGSSSSGSPAGSRPARHDRCRRRPFSGRPRPAVSGPRPQSRRRDGR